ncbi:MAG TPA: GNAT family N-acetyltransferase [Acidimicrobiales bacterium]|nr:GNAT family N-acetyltransferase [Acidimicrobiales bacterium]
MPAAELARVAEIDRTERIDMLYVQDGELLVERHGRWDSPAWDHEGDGEHSIAAKVRELHAYIDLGGVAVGALVEGRLVGIGVVVSNLRPGIAQLAFLHVTAARRATGIGSLLCDELERIARADGATEMVVSATPSENTVRFYLGRGFEPTATPLAELFEAEPEDVHMRKSI